MVGGHTISPVHSALPRLTYPAPVSNKQMEMVVIIMVEEKATSGGQEVNAGTELVDVEVIEVWCKVASHRDQVGRDY